jgi:hypothetical protein
MTVSVLRRAIATNYEKSVSLVVAINPGLENLTVQAFRPHFAAMAGLGVVVAVAKRVVNALSFCLAVGGTEWLVSTVACRVTIGEVWHVGTVLSWCFRCRGVPCVADLGGCWL